MRDKFGYFIDLDRAPVPVLHAVAPRVHVRARTQISGQLRCGMRRHTQRGAVVEQRPAQFAFRAEERKHHFAGCVHGFAFDVRLVVLLAVVMRTFVENQNAACGRQGNGSDHVCVARLDAAHAHCIARCDMPRELFRQMRRKMNLTRADDEALDFTVRVQ